MVDMYEFFDAEYATCQTALAIRCMCEWLEVSKSGFYEWRSRPQSATAKRRQELAALITYVLYVRRVRRGPGRAGYPPVHRPHRDLL